MRKEQSAIRKKDRIVNEQSFFATRESVGAHWAAVKKAGRQHKRIAGKGAVQVSKPIPGVVVVKPVQNLESREMDDGEEDQCGVTDPYFNQCRLKYGHKEIHDFPPVVPVEEDNGQQELFGVDDGR